RLQEGMIFLAGDGDEIAKTTIRQEDHALLEPVPESAEELQFGGVLVAQGHLQQRAARHGKKSDPAQQRETATGLLASGLGISALVFGGVRGAVSSAIADQDFFAMEAPLAWGTLFGGLSGGLQGALESAAVQAAAGLAIGAIVFLDLGAAQQSKPSHDLAHGLAARAARVEDLPEESPEADLHSIDALAAVGTFVGLGKKAGGEIRAEELLQFVGRGGGDLVSGVEEGSFGGVEFAEEVSGGEHKLCM